MQGPDPSKDPKAYAEGVRETLIARGMSVGETRTGEDGQPVDYRVGRLTVERNLAQLEWREALESAQMWRTKFWIAVFFCGVMIAAIMLRK